MLSLRSLWIAGGALCLLSCNHTPTIYDFEPVVAPADLESRIQALL